MVQKNHLYLPAKWQQMSSGVVEFMAKCLLRGHPSWNYKLNSKVTIAVLALYSGKNYMNGTKNLITRTNYWLYSHVNDRTIACLDRLPTTSVDHVLPGQLDFHCPNECVSKMGFSAKNSRLFHILLS